MINLSLNQYLSLAKTLILKYGGGYKNKLIRDENAIGEVAYALMMADQNYDSTKGTKESTWRIQNAIFKISHLIREIRKNPHISLNEIDFAQKEPIENNCEEIIQKNRGILTQKQIDYLNLTYIDGFSQKEIAKQKNVTKQAVSFSLKRATKRLQKNGIFN